MSIELSKFLDKNLNVVHGFCIGNDINFKLGLEIINYQDGSLDTNRYTFTINNLKRSLLVLILDLLKVDNDNISKILSEFTLYSTFIIKLTTDEVKFYIQNPFFQNINEKKLTVIYKYEFYQKDNGIELKSENEEFKQAQFTSENALIDRISIFLDKRVMLKDKYNNLYYRFNDNTNFHRFVDSILEYQIYTWMYDNIKDSHITLKWISVKSGKISLHFDIE